MWNKNLLGQTLLQRFRVDAFVAAGGMGVVYKAWDLQRSVYLAMKVLHSDLAGDPAAFARFQREAGHLKNLAHPNIVPFYGLFQTEDQAFLLEAFIDGPSLKEILAQRQGRPLLPPEVLGYLRPLCASLGYAHSLGVVHCDVKPGNVLVDHAGAVYLTDFGISHQAESSNVTLGYAGSPAYMAPEQIRGEPLTPAVDIYALGVMLFEMLTGQRPFLGSEPELDLAEASPAERMRAAHLRLPPPDPLRLNPRIPAALGEVIRTALAKDPAQRYASTRDLFHAALRASGVAAVDDPLGREPADRGRAAPVPMNAPRPAEPDSSPDPNLAQTRPFPPPWSAPAAPAAVPPRRPSRIRWLGGLVLLLLLFAALAWIRPWNARSQIGKTSSTPAVPGQAAAQRKPSQSAPLVIPNTASTPPAPTQRLSTKALTPPAPATAQMTATSALPLSAPAQMTATSASPLPAPAQMTATRALPLTAPTQTLAPQRTAPPSGGAQAALQPSQTQSVDRPPAGRERWTSPRDGMLLLRVPAGPFQMGSDASPWAFERPPHTVTLNEFWIDQTEVTNAMFARFVQATGYVTRAEQQKGGFVYQNGAESHVDGANWQHPFGPASDLQNREDYPVVQLAWADAQAYCAWAGRRLPTEAEWEKAARGTDGRLYPWGSQIDCQHANYDGCKNGLTPVNAYPDGASPYGALDMAGNAWEWVADWYQADYYAQSPAENPTGPASGQRRVHRGGGWYNFNLQVQAPYRFSNDPTWTFSSVGVRCALTP